MSYSQSDQLTTRILLGGLLLCAILSKPVTAQEIILEAPGPVTIPEEPRTFAPEFADPNTTIDPNTTVDSNTTFEPDPSFEPDTSFEPNATVEPESLQSESMGEHVQVPTGPAAGYWIVSSRRCPQYGGSFKPCCQPAYLRFNAAGCGRRATREELLNSLDPGVPVCVVVHGSFVNWKEALTGGRQVNSWLRSAAPDRPINIVLFSWPSESPATMILPIDIGLLGQRSAYYGVYLAEFLSQLPPDRPLTLIGHSHGTRTAAAALHLMGGGTVQGLRLGHGTARERRIRVVLAAAAIDNNWLVPGARYGRALCRTEQLVNLINREDWPLRYYRYRSMTSAPALARTGFTRQIRRCLGAYNCKVADVDVTSTIGDGHSWENYYDHPEIARTIAPTVFHADMGAAPAGSTAAYQHRSPTIVKRREPRVAPVSVVRETFSHFTRTAPIRAF